MVIQNVESEGRGPRFLSLDSPHSVPPRNYTFFRFQSEPGEPGRGRLLAERADGTRFPCFEFDVVPNRSGSRLVFLPPETERLVLELHGQTRIQSVTFHEMGSLLLVAALAARWLRRQLRRPDRLVDKVVSAAGVVVRQGPRAARAALLAADASVVDPDFGAAAAAVRTSGTTRARDSKARALKQRHDERADRELAEFLAGGSTLCFAAPDHPEVSIIVVLYGRAELTLECLRAVSAHGGRAAEVVLVDNASPDETPVLLDSVVGATVIRNESNLGFVRACRQGAARARGRYLLLLNSDAVLTPGALDSARRTLSAVPSAGVVGGALVALDGRLQEAGSVVWSDGSCTGYGRGDDPDASEYQFRRDVDFVSGAFLLTPRAVWEELGGFDDAFAPMYYEDVDYCLRAKERGYRVIYDPGARVVHYEYGSSGNQTATEYMLRHRRLLLDRHGDELASHEAQGGNLLAARSTRDRRPRVLVIDDRLPVPHAGAGAPRTAAILRALDDIGAEVTFYPVLPTPGGWHDVRRSVPPDIEVVLGKGRNEISDFLAARRNHYNVIVTSRRHNMAALGRARTDAPSLLKGSRLVYDMEAIAANRYITAASLRGQTLSSTEIERLVADEVSAAAGADVVLAVSMRERQMLLEAGVPTVEVLGHAVDPNPTTSAFEQRDGFLFVGPLVQEDAPNTDAVVWFATNVLPLLRERLGEVRFAVAGRATVPNVTTLARAGVDVLGTVDDLVPLYEQARVFVAPTRFAAGIPLKVLEAAAHGVPVVATELLAGQLDWTDGRELLTASATDAQAFAAACVRLYADESCWRQCREEALSRVTREWSYDQFRADLGAILGAACR